MRKTITPSPRLLPLVVCVLSALPALAAAPDDKLGRLFHTPQQRAVLDDLRSHNAKIRPGQDNSRVTLNGIVRRNGGASTVWINGVPYHDRQPLASWTTSSAKVFVGHGKTAEVKVGGEIVLTNNFDTP